MELLEILRSPQSGLKTVGHVNFFENIVDVGPHRMGTDAQLIGDLLVFGANGNQGKDFNFSCRQQGRFRFQRFFFLPGFTDTNS